MTETNLRRKKEERESGSSEKIKSGKVGFKIKPNKPEQTSFSRIPDDLEPQPYDKNTLFESEFHEKIQEEINDIHLRSLTKYKK